ncbi:MAG: hypothetical protein BWY06_00771 [Candidatus Latescibacteria bacterium ADurb.Bin168]|nr:MAG: hypothetical protein BWY06_00771 [Candidatus Latescibacteria bacterium ADurb.Bin168]
MQRSTTEGTGAILMSSGMPFRMYHAMASSERGARPCPHSTFVCRVRASWIMSGTSPPMEQSPWSVTFSAKIVATAASAAFPPASRRLIPAATASAAPAVTTPVALVAFQPIVSV